MSHAIHALDGFVESAFLWSLSRQHDATGKVAHLCDLPHDHIFELPFAVLEQVRQILSLASVADGASDIVTLLEILSNNVTARISNEIGLASLTRRCIRTRRSQGSWSLVQLLACGAGVVVDGHKHDQDAKSR